MYELRVNAQSSTRHCVVNSVWTPAYPVRLLQKRLQSQRVADGMAVGSVVQDDPCRPDLR